MEKSVSSVECILLAVLSSKACHENTTCDDRYLHVCTSKSLLFAVPKKRTLTSGDREVLRDTVGLSKEEKRRKSIP